MNEGVRPGGSVQVSVTVDRPSPLVATGQHEQTSHWMQMCKTNETHKHHPDIVKTRGTVMCLNTTSHQQLWQLCFVQVGPVTY